MKTLDEVIEKCRGYVDDVARGWDKQDCSLPYDDMMDALHYLLEYRTEQKILSDCKEHYKYWAGRYYNEIEKNEPLTWDELKQMEGKPVWVEWQDHNKEWFLIDSIDKKKVVFRSQSGFGWYCIRRENESWQAYRKERS